jgi:Domain of unknown function (DUF222)
MVVERLGHGLRLGADSDLKFLYFLEKQLAIEHIFEYNRSMQLGDSTATTHEQRSRLDKALDHFDSAITELITTVETGELDQLEGAEKVAVWQRFERTRNKLPLVDHRLIAHADATDLPRQYCSSTMIQFLVRVLQLSHGDAAARVHAAAALGPRASMLGERLEPLLPQLAAFQHEGVVSTEKVQIVERAMNKLTRPSLDPEGSPWLSSSSPNMPSSWRRRS